MMPINILAFFLLCDWQVNPGKVTLWVRVHVKVGRKSLRNRPN